MDYKEFFPIKEYYERVVIPLNPKRFHVHGDKMICCLHKDTDPSLGIVYSKSKGEQYHCFGCNSWGTVVDLHIKVSKKYFKKDLSFEDALKDLCRLFNVNFNDLPLESDFVERTNNDYLRKALELEEAVNSFSIQELKDGIIRGKLDKKGPEYFNTLLVKTLGSLD